MVNKAEERTEIKEDVIFKTLADSNAAFSKQWEDSYLKLYKPWIESIMTLSDKMAEIKYAKSVEPNGEMVYNFVESTNIYLIMYKSWISALEKMSEKAKEMSIQNSDPQAFEEFNNRWLKMYEKAFESFFEDMPTAGGPMKVVMEPVKIMSKMYADTFIKMSKMWARSDSGTASA